MPNPVSFQVFVEDGDAQPVPKAQIALRGPNETSHDIGTTDDAGRTSLVRLDPGTYQLTASDPSGRLQPETRAVELVGPPVTITVILGEPNQPFYRAGDTKVFFRSDEKSFLLIVRGDNAPGETERRVRARGLDVALLPTVTSSPTLAEGGAEEPRDVCFARVYLRQDETVGGSGNLMDALAGELRETNLRVIVALPVIRGDQPMRGLTNEAVVRFLDGVGDADVSRIGGTVGMKALRKLTYAGNGYLMARSGPPTYEVLAAVESLRGDNLVQYAESNVLVTLELDQYAPNDVLWPNMTHLPLIDCDDAWDFLDNISVNLRGGSPDITIAVFDPNGVAPNHPDLTANLTDGASKLVTSFNFNAMAAQTVAGLGGDHGTECAGIATAAFDNNQGIAGVAPNCHLIGARLPSPATGVEMADAFTWSAGFNPGSTDPNFPAVPARAADVISNSWGSTNTALSQALQDCFDFLTLRGRAGRGCVVTFSTGNLGYVQFSAVRTYAAYNRTIAVGASINVNPTNPVNSCQADQNGNTNNLAAVVDRRAYYSPWGPEMDIVAPSHTAYGLGPPPIGGCAGLVDPTTSSVRVGTGTLDGCAPAPACLDYDTSFGGTSHASPTIAGTAALMLSANPDLCWADVRTAMRTTAVQIDPAQTNAVGAWTDLDGDGVNEFSQWYGYGRVDVDQAVQNARQQGKPCYAPTFDPVGCVGCLVLTIVYTVVIAALAIVALFSKEVRCYIKQLGFRIRNCAAGNQDNCIRL